MRHAMLDAMTSSLLHDLHGSQVPVIQAAVSTPAPRPGSGHPFVQISATARSGAGGCRRAGWATDRRARSRCGIERGGVAGRGIAGRRLAIRGGSTPSDPARPR
jgi:hypothetical protein